MRIIDNKGYKLNIPQHMRDAGLTPIFLPWKLHLVPENVFPGQVLLPEPPMLISDDDGDTHEEWEVLDIVDCQKTKRYGVQYKATYIGNWKAHPEYRIGDKV